jgi:hypothetical protein
MCDLHLWFFETLSLPLIPFLLYTKKKTNKPENNFDTLVIPNWDGLSPSSAAPLVNRMQPLARTLLSVATSLGWQHTELFSHSFPNGNSIINGARSFV